MNITHRLIVIFCQMDDFCKKLYRTAKHYLLLNPSSKGHRGLVSGLAVSEISHSGDVSNDSFS